MIKHKYTQNSDDIFLRHLYAGLTEKLDNVMSYYQIENDETKKRITLPVFLGATGSERYLQYYFSDRNYQICEEVFPEGSFDMIPRGHLTLTNSDLNSQNNTSFYARADIYEADENGYILEYDALVAMVPVQASFSLEVLCNSEGEQMKIWQSLIKSLYWTRSFHFVFDGVIVPTEVAFPDNPERNKNFEWKNGNSSVDYKIIKIPLDVETYLPIVTDKHFKGNRIEIFSTSYENSGDNEIQETQYTASVQGTIKYENTPHNALGTIELTNDNDSDFSYETELEDGSFLFTDVPARTGYRLKDSDGNTLQKKIHLTPFQEFKTTIDLFFV
jgi:hypothetical protein